MISPCQCGGGPGLARRSVQGALASAALVKVPTYVCNRYSHGAPRAIMRQQPSPAVREEEHSSSTQFLTRQPYEPPAWAAQLHPLPSSRIRLAMLPTPIHAWPVALPDPSIQLFIKRDDLTGMQMSGNKVRKLEFIMAEAVARGHDCVVTIGGIQSNHCRATAVAARYLGLGCHLLLRTSRTVVDEDPGLVGNLLVDRLCGATIHKVTKEEYVKTGSGQLGAQLVQQLQAQGLNPLLIPVGGSNALGTWGWIHAVEEMAQQVKAMQLDITDLVMACGSGGTTAGLTLGVHLSGLPWRVHAYSVCDTPDYFYKFVDGLISDLGLQQSDNTSSRQLLEVVDAKGQGYAQSLASELLTTQEIANTTGVILDPVYSGKAMHYLLEEMKAQPSKWAGRKVLFVHTGGLLGIYDKVDQLQPLLEKNGPPVLRFCPTA